MWKSVIYNDYSKFESQAYFETFYSGLELPHLPKDYFTNILGTLYGIYNNGNIKGSTILDFGTGPTVYSLVSAARHFPNIYLSDFCENNRNALWRWLTKDPGSNNFSHFFEYQVQKEESGCSWEELQDDMRSRIRGILSCDMTRDNPLYPSIFPQFDVISTSFCISAEPSRTMSGYEAAVKNVSSLLKPGGCVVYLDVLGGSYYKVGLCHYDAMPLTKEIVYKSWADAGFSIDSWKQFDKSDKERNECIATSDTMSFFCTICKKKE